MAEVNLASYIPLVGVLLNVSLAIFVLWTGHKAAANRVYFCLGLAIATWNLGGYWLLILDDPEEALFWARVLFIGVIPIPTLLFHLSLLVAQMKVRKEIWICYAASGLLMAANFTPIFIRGVRKLGESGFYAQPGWLFPGFMLIFNLVGLSIYFLIKRRKQLGPHHRSRLDALIFAQSCLMLFGMNDLLPFQGFDYYPFTKSYVYPYGALAAVFYGLIVAYSVLQRHLLDVQIQLSRVAAQFVRFLFLFFIGLALLLTCTLIAPPRAFNNISFSAALVVLMVSSILASLLFPRLFGGEGLDKLERHLLGDRFEYQDQIRSFIGNMTWYSDMNSLLNDLDDLLRKTFRLESYEIIIRDETTRAFSRLKSLPEKPNDVLPEFKAQSPVFQYFEWGKGEYLALNPGALRLAGSPIERQARQQLQSFGATLCFALSSQEEPFGLLIVGNKASGEPYTATDINLLVSLVKTMGLMVNQIRLKNQILHAQELDLLGRMSRGMAHDLNNLLTPVSTLFQLVQETGLLDEELLPVAVRNVSIMRAYIRESLFFSENLRPDFQFGRLDVLVEQAADVARDSRNKQVKVTPVTPGEIIAEMDAVLIQRLIANLITNAIDASKPGTEVMVVLERLAKTDEERDWLRVRVIDQGEGISRENLGRVLKPYFTTKNRGDETRGFGLGLAICRKIVTLHGGSVTIESELRQGTTVQIDLPSHQLSTTRTPLTAQPAAQQAA